MVAPYRLSKLASKPELSTCSFHSTVRNSRTTNARMANTWHMYCYSFLCYPLQTLLINKLFWGGPELCPCSPVGSWFVSRPVWWKPISLSSLELNIPFLFSSGMDANQKTLCPLELWKILTQNDEIIIFPEGRTSCAVQLRNSGPKQEGQKQPRSYNLPSAWLEWHQISRCDRGGQFWPSS